ncbi:MAG: uracil-DNA glycosylase, partial [Flavobacteriales bacterium]|nr:uracil-DNA glycosylase [Flavobacteriales bacterium]
MKLEKSWNTYLSAELEKDYMISLKNFLTGERQDYLVYPKEEEAFNSFHKTPFNKLKIVLLGQDPYHGEGQAHGLSFSVPKEVKTPPSLINIFKEIENDLNIKNHGKGDLTKWAEQGVLLLNSTLTVRKNMAGSHQNKGWEQFTDKVISTISSKKEGV